MKPTKLYHLKNNSRFLNPDFLRKLSISDNSKICIELLILFDLFKTCE